MWKASWRKSGLRTLASAEGKGSQAGRGVRTRSWNVILGKKKAYSVFLHGNNKIYCFETQGLNVNSVSVWIFFRRIGLHE